MDPRLSPPALEVLGALAPFQQTGPHRAPPLRRLTRLTPAAFEGALAELQRRGLVSLGEGDALWMTGEGERLTTAVFA